MWRRLAIFATLSAAVFGAVSYQAGLFGARLASRAGREIAEKARSEPLGPPLYSPAKPAAPAAPHVPGGSVEPIVVPECRLCVIEKQDVPSQRDGVILYIGTDLEPGQTCRPDQVVKVRVGTLEKTIRRLREGDVVKAGQLLGSLDDQLSRDDWYIKTAQVASSRADLEAALKACEEAKNRYDTQARLRQEGRGVAAEEEVRSAKLTWDRAAYEAASKREAVALAERELSQAETILRMHQLRSTAPGVVRTIFKGPGEAVKSYEPVFQIQNLARLRVEGLVDVQHLPRLRAGMQAVVEPVEPVAAEQTLLGHLQEITGVAVTRNGMIVSASEDASVRVWNRRDGNVLRTLAHPAAIRSLACTPPTATRNLCLTGAADGSARLWDLDKANAVPADLSDAHAGAVTATAFSPDGTTCATAGEDRSICLWSVANGALRYRIPAGHRAAITHLQFTPQAQLVSAARDNTIRVWGLGEKGARSEAVFERRSGDVTLPGVSPDGKHLLFDQDNALRLLSLPDGATAGVLQAANGDSGFTAFALFSPDGRLIVTTRATEGHVQLWRTPSGRQRAYELRQLVGGDFAAASCAAFAPDGSFVVVGARDRRLRVWRLPSAEERERQLTAEITLVERIVESSTRQVRLWAELANPDGRLLPGTTVTLVIDPSEAEKASR